MKLKLDGTLFSFDSYTDSAAASVHLHPDTDIKVRHFPKSERCHEFLNIDLTPADGQDVRVSIYGTPEDVRRLAEAIGTALGPPMEAGDVAEAAP